MAQVDVTPAPDDRILVFAMSVGVAKLPDGTNVNVIASGKTLEVTVGRKRYWSDITPIVTEAIKLSKEA